MRRTLPSALALVFLALAGQAACSRGEAASEPAPAAARAPGGSPPRLVFFMNPYGRPCQMQQRVLDDMRAELKGKVELVPYRTTSREDVAQFGRYGIRALPALVLTDASGRELRRATPGIQDAAAIRRLIGQ